MHVGCPVSLLDKTQIAEKPRQETLWTNIDIQ